MIKLILIIILILLLMFKPTLDINRITGDLLLWYKQDGRREFIILIHNFYKKEDE